LYSRCISLASVFIGIFPPVEKELSGSNGTPG
jgi:hypothetical protein